MFDLAHQMHLCDELEAQGHFPSGPYRGYKSDAWDGGHRIPCIARWPGVVRPESESGELVCLSDLMATCVDLGGAKYPTTVGDKKIVPIQGTSLAPAFNGKDIGRAAPIFCSSNLYRTCEVEF